MEQVITISALIVAMLVAWRWPAARRTMIFGAIFSLPLIITEFLLTGSFARLGTTAFGRAAELATVIAGMLSIGALAAGAADRLTRRWWGSAAHPARYRLWWLGLGMIISAGLLISGQPVPVALMIGLAINSLLVVTIERDLIWDAVVASVAFAVLFVAIDLALGIRAAGDITRLLIGPTAIGLTVVGLPLERLLTIALLGAVIGPLFSATKFRRTPTVERQRTIPAVKIWLVIVLAMLINGSLALAAPVYILPPSVQTITPSTGAQKVEVTAVIDILFNRPITRQALQLAIRPNVSGSWTFAQPRIGDHGFRRARYTFDQALPAGTTFEARLTGIQSIWRFVGRDYAWQFTTVAAPVVAIPDPIVTIPPVVVAPTPPPPTPVPVVPAPPAVTLAPTPAPTPVVAAPTQHLISVSQDYQDQALSCEAAALKMALAGQGVKVTESQIMNIVGYDPTPHRGNIWGDPSVAFVGNIAGHQDTTGYGVYWDPIAKAANHWRPSRAITNGTVEQLAREIYADHIVIIWGTIGNAYRDDWVTSNGKKILTWKGEHARTIIGVNGPADDPTSFILNDPVAGRVTWSTAKLDANWASFNRSGVIVE